MPKHTEILEKLNRLQKAALVASAFAAEPFIQADIPAVNVTPLDGADPNAISYGSAVRSWDPQLVGQLTQLLIAEKGCKNNLFVAPDLKSAVNPYAMDGTLSEDSFLNGEVGAAIVHAAHKVGAYIGLGRLSVSQSELDYIDESEDFAAVHELFTQPFVHAAQQSPCDAVLLCPSREGVGYHDTNRTLLNEVQNGLLGEDVFVVGEGETFSSDAVGMLHGKITLGGCTIPLERAVRRYAQLLHYEQEGSIPHREVEDSLLAGNAISDEALDELADHIIDFALALDAAELRTSPEQTEALSDSEVDIPVVKQADTPAADDAETTEQAQTDDVAEQTDLDETAQSDTAADLPPETELSESQPDEQQPQTDLPQDQVDYTEPTPVVDEPAPQETDVFADPDAVAKRLAAESIVLLKNNKILPLDEGKKIALVGDANFNTAAFGQSFDVVGKARGYDRTLQRSDTLIPAAVRCTKNADAAVVFLYPEPGKLTLPANRIALLSALKRAHKKVVAVVCGDAPVDMSFDDNVDALLVAPSDCPFAAEALADILCGKQNPSGRLTRTLYDNADEYYRNYIQRKKDGVMHIGSFVGYRRMSVEKTVVRYPFGYGLSYTQFTYSNLTLGEGQLSFTLTNSGKYDGAEVVQVYIGVPQTTRVAPSKQLRAFCRVFLRKGESRTVTLPLPERTFESYDAGSYTDTIEAGDYTIYVGPSPVDIRLTAQKTMDGVTREKTGYTFADYSPDADFGDVAHVGLHNRISQKTDPMSSELRLTQKIARYAVPICAILFFVAFSVILASLSIDYLLFEAAQLDIVEQAMFCAAVIAIALIPLAGSLNRKRLVRIRNVSMVLTPLLILLCLGIFIITEFGGVDLVDEQMRELFVNVLTCIAIGTPIMALIALLVERQLWRNQNGKNRWDRYYFEREKEGKTTSDEQFDQAMHAADVAREARVVKQKPEERVIIAEVPQFYDKRLTFEQLMTDCAQFVAEYGLTVSEDVLRNWIAAISSNQLVFVPQGGTELCSAVAEYFGRSVYVDNAERYVRIEDMFAEWHAGDLTNVPTNLARAFDKASKETAYLHTVLIRHVNPDFVETLFRPLADVVLRTKLTVPVAGKNVALPDNIVIVAELESDQTVLPPDIGAVAAQLCPQVSECEPAQHRTIVQTVGFERFKALCRTVCDDYPLDEDVWKQVDALDEHCKSAHIGNNMWNRMELHTSVALACGADPDDAMDSAIAVEVLPWLVTVWQDELCEITLPNALLDSFGDKLTQSMALLKNADQEK